MTNTTGDILQDRTGWFFRQSENGTLHCLSSAIRSATAQTPLITLVHNGQPTGEGDPLATRTALLLARRF